MFCDHVDRILFGVYYVKKKILKKILFSNDISAFQNLNNLNDWNKYAFGTSGQQFPFLWN